MRIVKKAFRGFALNNSELYFHYKFQDNVVQDAELIDEKDAFDLEGLIR
ncbi:36232_t:CDS:2 [Gigaspora margarita]|uniref:36232_t:CDS:1 n=1 Tax=Gigaspora margarita TaxID=4874 RepID=A0ABN7UD51_GIGMA|nr:36232_t:CDS:2 [Gigaspora margarita]